MHGRHVAFAVVTKAPVERLTIDCPEDYLGTVTQLLLRGLSEDQIAVRKSGASACHTTSGKTRLISAVGQRIST